VSSGSVVELMHSFNVIKMYVLFKKNGFQLSYLYDFVDAGLFIH
jgi:hypothetical protein